MRIGLFSTGGTIAMAPVGVGPGVAPRLGAEALASMSGADLPFEVINHDLFSKPSASISLPDVQLLADTIQSAFDAGIDGAVVTHGTDTLEETAFALSLFIAHGKPLIITGAMRTTHAVGSDGAANLGGALLLATNPHAHNQGPLVLFGEEIHAAHLVRKVHSSRPHAFSSEPFGPIGHVIEGTPRIEMRALFAPARLRIDGPVPAVPILQAGLDLEPETVDALATAGIGGVIIAGAGGGHVSSRAVAALERLASRVPVVLTSRVGMGGTLRSSYTYDGSEIDLARRGVINGGRWRPTQARILLQIHLSNGADRETIERALGYE